MAMSFQGGPPVLLRHNHFPSIWFAPKQCSTTHRMNSPSSMNSPSLSSWVTCTLRGGTQVSVPLLTSCCIPLPACLQCSTQPCSSQISTQKSESIARKQCSVCVPEYAQWGPRQGSSQRKAIHTHNPITEIVQYSASTLQTRCEMTLSVLTSHAQTSRSIALPDCEFVQPYVPCPLPLPLKGYDNQVKRGWDLIGHSCKLGAWGGSYCICWVGFGQGGKEQLGKLTHRTVVISCEWRETSTEGGKQSSGLTFCSIQVEELLVSGVSPCDQMYGSNTEVRVPAAGNSRAGIPSGSL